MGGGGGQRHNGRYTRGDGRPRVDVGAHQPAEQVYDNILFVTYFSGGLRMLDISNPYSPEEIGYYVPLPGKGQKAPMNNDVFRRHDAMPFPIDRFDVLEFL